jgi:hypothetical protein
MFYWRFTITIIIIVKLENLSLYFVNISVVFRSYSRVILLLFLDMIEIILYRMCIYNPFQTQHCHCKIDGVDSWNNLWIDNEQVHKTWIGFYSADNKTNTDHLATCNFQIISSWNKRQTHTWDSCFFVFFVGGGEREIGV